jgi:hypothetical protein
MNPTFLNTIAFSTSFAIAIGDGTGLDNPTASSRLAHLKCVFTERVFHEDCDELRLTFLPQTTQDDFDGTV